MNGIFLLLGSNRGDREDFLFRARKAIAVDAGKIIKVSSLYVTEPWGFTDEIPFINLVLEIDTTLGAEALLKVLLEIEKNLGRLRITPLRHLPPERSTSGEPGICCLTSDISESSYSGRTIDIDILFFADQIIFTESLMIPHPRLHDRRFVLEPLNEIVPDMVHPILKKSIRDLLSICTDHSKVALF